MRLRWIVCVLAVLGWPAAWAAGESELEPPVHVTAGGAPIDTGGIGYAAPFFADFDGDGVRDLLVGEFSQGRMRIFRNVGTDIDPRFEAHAFFEAGGELGRVPSGWCIGFTPQLVDFDDNGRTDVLSGSWPGELYLFRRNADGSFAAGEKLKKRDGKPINTGNASTAFAVDWNGNGRLDLVTGNITGEVHVLLNEGTREEPVYDQAVRLDLGSGLQGRSGDSGPIVADWDGDGLNDLLVGMGDGSVLWFRNIGTVSEPKFGPGRELVSKSPFGFDLLKRKPGELGVRVKIHAVDWNGNGRLDLLLGDRSGGPPPAAEATEEQTAAVNKVTELRRELSEVQAKIRELEGETQSGSDAETQREVKKLRARSAEIQEEFRTIARTGFNAVRRDGQQQPVRHGFVWLFLRK